MIIKNGNVIDPEQNRVYQADLYIKDGKIAKILERKTQENVDEVDEWLSFAHEGKDRSSEIVIDATGLYVGPGLCDTHVHFRDPGFTHKEDIQTGSEAAKAGGYTSIVLMANTNPKVDNVDTLKYVLEKGAKTGIHIYSCANVTMGMEGKELTDMYALKSVGAVGFTDDGIPIMDKDIVFIAMQICSKLGMPISFHEENKELISENGINSGMASDYYHVKGSPKEAEISMIDRDIKIASKVPSACVVIQHISTKEGVELVRAAKKNGLNIHAEGTPHHFSLTEMDAIKFGTNAKMNPPLRTEEDRQAVVEGIKDGTIDIIATDHAPHSFEEKDKPMTEAPSGIIGLETALSLAIQNLVNRGALTYPELFRRMSYTPCKLYKLPGGVIKEGAPADLVIFNPSEVWEVTSFKSKSSNSPFLGKRLPGVIKYTICNGKAVYIM